MAWRNSLFSENQYFIRLYWQMYHHITNSKQCEIIERWRSEQVFTEDLAVTISDCRDPWCFCIFTLSVFPKISRVNTQDTPSAKKSSNSFLFNGLSSTSFSKIFSPLRFSDWIIFIDLSSGLHSFPFVVFCWMGPFKKICSFPNLWNLWILPYVINWCD